MKEAMFYRSKGSMVSCFLCPHRCVIRPGSRGKCGVRENRDGMLYSLVFGKAISTAVDPIEKKPLFHFMPGSHSYSVATVGCNLFCGFCQNWEISQQPKPDKAVMGRDLSPEAIVEDAIANNCQSISYTYTEPTIFFEYAYETARLARKKGLKNVFVTNGYITRPAIAKISRYLDAANVDLKGFSEEYYQNVCGASLQPVLDAIREYHKKNVWLELTTLIMPGHNDSPEMLGRIAEFIASLDRKIPWHISRYFPHYKMRHVPPTDIGVIHKAVEIGKKHSLKYIYAGNVPGDSYESTYCPKCKKKVIDRSGFSVNNTNLEEDRCAFCNEKIDLIQP